MSARMAIIKKTRMQVLPKVEEKETPHIILAGIETGIFITEKKQHDSSMGNSKTEPLHNTEILLLVDT